MSEATHKRWYDVDPTISLSVNLMQNAQLATKLKCATLIIETAKFNNIELKSLTDKFDYILRRWYDEDLEISKAFDYFRLAPIEIQKEISLELINLIMFEQEEEDYV